MTLYYIRYKHGMGNRILFLIMALYIHYRTKKKVNVILDGKPIAHKGSEDVLCFFNKFEPILKFVPWGNTHYSVYTMPTDFRKYKDAIEGIFRAEGDHVLVCDSMFVVCFQHAPYVFHELLPMRLRDQYFTPNLSMISAAVKQIIKQPIAVVHIRWGDKLILERKRGAKCGYCLAGPKFYEHYINLLLKQTSLPIFILTDSFAVVKDRFAPLLQKERIQVLDCDLFNAFYLLMHARYIIAGSTSTFSSTAMSMSKRLLKAVVFTTGSDEFCLTKHLKRYKPIVLETSKKWLLNANIPEFDRLLNAYKAL